MIWITRAVVNQIFCADDFSGWINCRDPSVSKCINIIKQLYIRLGMVSPDFVDFDFNFGAYCRGFQTSEFCHENVHACCYNEVMP